MFCGIAWSTGSSFPMGSHFPRLSKTVSFPLHTTRHAAHKYLRAAGDAILRLTGLNLRSTAKIGIFRLGFSFISLLSTFGTIRSATWRYGGGGSRLKKSRAMGGRVYFARGCGRESSHRRGSHGRPMRCLSFLDGSVFSAFIVGILRLRIGTSCRWNLR
jgi:hypothetical protein